MSKESKRLTPLGDDAVLTDGSRERQRVLDIAASEQRMRALFVDPSLAAAGRPREEFSDQEVRDLKRSVLQARRLREVEASSGEPVSHGLSGLAIALTLCLVFLLPSSLRRTPDSIADVPLPASPGPGEIITHSAVETLDLPGARVYELANEDFSVVLVVDESFEL